MNKKKLKNKAESKDDQEKINEEEKDEGNKNENI